MQKAKKKAIGQNKNFGKTSFVLLFEMVTLTPV